MDDRTASALLRPLENLRAGSSAGQDAAAFPINKPNVSYAHAISMCGTHAVTWRDD